MAKDKKLGQEPAFAKSAYVNETAIDPPQEGISKRFYAACAAMQGLLANPDWARTAKIPDDFDEYKSRIAVSAFDFADELLKQEDNEKI